ncbi:MAG: hypothetical protein E7000_01145 [Coriobacteriaceae bacterium]|nr:hypothetical protein [Coriobacteriaceae bacterium]
MANKKRNQSTKGKEPAENPYARRRLVAAILTIACLIAYFVIPPVGYEVPRLVVLIVFFVLITVCTLFQQQYRQWRDEHRPRR